MKNLKIVLVVLLTFFVSFSFANPFILAGKKAVKSKTAKEIIKTFKEKRGADLIKKGKQILVKSRLGGNILGKLKNSKSIKMPKSIKGKSSTKKGFLRDKLKFWKKFQKKYPNALSPKNKERIKKGKAPVVDKQWIKTFPEHKLNAGEKLEHHHLKHGSKAIPLPKTLHRGSGNTKILHNFSKSQKLKTKAKAKLQTKRK